MNRTEKRNMNEKLNSPYFSLFKGFELNSPKEKVRKVMYRSTSYDFVVDWQLDEKMPDKNPVR